MSSSSKKVIVAALIGNSLVAITKFIAAAMTGSSAMMSEGIHSVVDTGNQVLLLYGLRQAQKPPDDNFPFGHGKEVYFWSFIVAILIFALGAGISIYEGVSHLFHPVLPGKPMINYIVLGLAMLFEGAAWYFAFKSFVQDKGKQGYIEAVKKGKDPTTFVVLFEDSAAMLGLMIAFLGIWLTQLTGLAYFDGIASILIGLLLAATATWLAYETKGLLIGESANRWIVEGVRELVGSVSAVEKVNEVLTMHIGPDYILVNVSLDFRDNTPADEVEKIVAGLDCEIKANYAKVKRVFIEARSAPDQTQVLSVLGRHEEISMVDTEPELRNKIDDVIGRLKAIQRTIAGSRQPASKFELEELKELGLKYEELNKHLHSYIQD